MEIIYTFYFFEKVIEKLMTFCHWQCEQIDIAVQKPTTNEKLPNRVVFCVMVSFLLV